MIVCYAFCAAVFYYLYGYHYSVGYFTGWRDAAVNSLDATIINGLNISDIASDTDSPTLQSGEQEGSVHLDGSVLSSVNDIPSTNEDSKSRLSCDTQAFY